MIARRVIRHLSVQKPLAPHRLARVRFFGSGSSTRALALSRRYGGVANTIARSTVIYRLIRLHLEKTSAPAPSSALAPPATTGPSGERFLESERADASRRFLPHRQIIVFDFSLRFLSRRSPAALAPSHPFHHPLPPLALSRSLSLSLSLPSSLLFPRRQPSSPSPRRESARDRRSLPSYIITLFPNNWPIYTRVPAENNPPLSLSVSRYAGLSRALAVAGSGHGVCPIGPRRAVILCIWECD